MGEWPELGERLRQRIQELGFENAAKFADAKGYRVTYVYKWMAGTMPSRANLERLASDLQTSPSWLMFGDGKTSRKLTPIGGGSADERPRPLVSAAVAMRLIRSWLRHLLCPIVNPTPCFV